MFNLQSNSTEGTLYIKSTYCLSSVSVALKQNYIKIEKERKIMYYTNIVQYQYLEL